MFWCVSYYLGAFGCLTKLGSKWAEVGKKFVPWSRVGIFRNEAPDPPHWTLTSCFCAFRTIWVHLGQFGCVTKLSAKQAKLVQKFVPRSHVGIFRNECTRSTPFDSKFMFWCVLYYLDAFGTVWLSYKTQYKTGWTGAKVRATKSRHNFSQRTHLIDPVGTWTHVSVRFVLFGCIWYRLVALQNLVQNEPKWCKSSCHEVVAEFFTMNHSIHPIGP